MKISALEIDGCFIIEPEEFKDERGSFMRQFCKKELYQKIGIEFDIKQCNISTNVKAGTLRGMHYQLGQMPESKIVSCITGKIYDVIVDVRPYSVTYLKWCATELSENNHKAIYMPPGIAHGFQTLVDNSTVFYQLDQFFSPNDYFGVRWNDPKINIIWPEVNHRIINIRDQNYKLI